MQAELDAALAVLNGLNLTATKVREQPRSGHHSSLLIPCAAADGRRFVLKWLLPPAGDRLYPVSVRVEDFARREAAFYRLLDDLDPNRRDFPAPRTVLLGPGDPPAWLLLEWIEAAPGPQQESLAQDTLIELIERMQRLPMQRLFGRRSFPLHHWDPIGYHDQIRMMYDAALTVVGERRWRQMQHFFDEATRWTDTRQPVLVHGDFCEENIVVAEDGRAHVIDFERIGIGNQDHDLAWFWIHSQRDHNWKRSLLQRWVGSRVGGDRIRCEWGIRTTLVYLAIRRLRWGYLTHGEDDPRASANLALLDAALQGGGDLFPF